MVRLQDFINSAAYTEKKCYWIKSMYITDSNQYAIELVTYLLVLVVYFYEFIVYMLLQRNAFDSIAFFSQCTYFLRSNVYLLFLYRKSLLKNFLNIFYVIYEYSLSPTSFISIIIIATFKIMHRNSIFSSA